MRPEGYDQLAASLFSPELSSLFLAQITLLSATVPAA